MGGDWLPTLSMINLAKVPVPIQQRHMGLWRVPAFPPTPDPLYLQTFHVSGNKMSKSLALPSRGFDLVAKTEFSGIRAQP